MMNKKSPFDFLYDSKMTVTGYVKEKNKGITSQKEVVLFENAPCRISQNGNKSTNGTDYQANGYDMKLFCGLEYDIPAGSKIEITDRNGHIKVYERSNVPINQYWHHQEIAINLKGKS